MSIVLLGSEKVYVRVLYTVVCLLREEIMNVKSSQQRLKEQKSAIRFGSTAIEEKQPGFLYTHGTVEQQIMDICFKTDTIYVCKGKSIIVDPTVTSQTVSTIPCFDVYSRHSSSSNNNNNSSSSAAVSTDQYTPEDRSDLV
jgi:hypothetical protein